MSSKVVGGQEVLIRQEATPWSVSVRLTNEEKAARFVGFWETVKSGIFKEVGKGFKKGKGGTPGKDFTPEVAAKLIPGGLGKIYYPLLRSIVMERLETSFESEILLLDDLRYHKETIGDIVEHVVSAKFWPEPKVVFEDDLTLDIQKPSYPSVDELVDKEIQQLRQSSAIEIPKENPIVEDGDIIIADVNASIDGKRWDLGCLKNSSIRVVRQAMHPEELYEHFLGMRPGEKKIAGFTLNDKFGSLDGKRVSSVLLVKAVLCESLPDFSEEFIREKGFEDIADFRSKISGRVSESLEHQKKQTRIRLGVTKLIEKSKIDPIPEKWIDLKTRDFWIQQEQLLGKEEVKKRLGEFEDFSDMARNQIVTELIQILVLRSWGRRMEVEQKEGESISNTNTYLERVQERLLEELA